MFFFWRKRGVMTCSLYSNSVMMKIIYIQHRESEMTKPYNIFRGDLESVAQWCRLSCNSFSLCGPSCGRRQVPPHATDIALHIDYVSRTCTCRIIYETIRISIPIYDGVIFLACPAHFLSGCDGSRILNYGHFLFKIF